jgi:uncharacterized protein (TIRG00374 family)
MNESPAILAADLRPDPDSIPRVARRGEGRTRHRLVRALPLLLAVAAVGSLLAFVDPREVVESTRRFDLPLALPLLLVGSGYYLLQGLRWHFLLRAVGARERLRDSELINLAGQSVTAVMPLGDLTRAFFAARVSGVAFGAAAATVTVQELTFTVLLVLAAAPGLAHLPDGLAWMVAVVLGVGAVVAILTVPWAYRAVRALVASTPGLRQLGPQVDALQQGVRSLLLRPQVLAGTLIDLARALLATAGMMLILRGLRIDSVGWWEAALVVAVAYVGGAVSLLPGGIGANEASVVGILALLGVNPAVAAAAALLQRLWLSGYATLGGLAAYAVVRRRFQLTGPGRLATLATVVRGGAPSLPVAAPAEGGDLVAAA